MIKSTFKVFLGILSLMFWSCDNNVLAPEPFVENPVSGLDTTMLQGTGSFTYSSYIPLATKPIEVFYHIPSTANSLTPILFALHGSDRGGSFSRTSLIDDANALNFIVIAPQFSDQFYPGGDAYNLGNIFLDGDNPSTATLNNEELWTFSPLEPLFDLIRTRLGSSVTTYDLFGFSAGAQFVHRYLIYKPQARVHKAVSASSGWYTMLDPLVVFPYGTLSSPAANWSYNELLAKQVYIIVGDADTDENSFSLRHNSEVDKQGLNRYDRAQYFFTKSQAYATAKSTSFNWQYKSLPNVGHDYNAASAAAVILLYQ